MDDFRDLEHPDVKAAVRTGHAANSQPKTGRTECANCGNPVEPGDEKYNVLLEYGGKMLCVDCFEDAVVEDLHRDPVEFAKSLLMEVEQY